MLQKSRVSLSSDYLRFDLDDPFVSDFPSQNSKLYPLLLFRLSLSTPYH